jgi:hypothetical protein
MTDSSSSHARYLAGTVVNEHGQREGLDTRKIDETALGKIGHARRPLLDAVRAKCLDCSANNQSEAAKCTAVACALWPYRFGTNPFRQVSDAQREAGRRLAAIREGRR